MGSLPTVAALYIDPRGVYPDLSGVEWWALPYRDARKYAGPHPVVAHPPCGAWGKLRHLHKRNDSDCAPRAVDQVRQWGGVLEHPAHSLLWEAVAMPRPEQPADQFGGFTLEVCQVDWGHVARKPTWLYLVGVPRGAIESRARREPTHWVSGLSGAVPHGIKICSAEQRRRTPPDFARYLIKLARGAAEARVA